MSEALYVIRGEISGSMCYLCQDEHEKNMYVAQASGTGIHKTILFKSRQDAENALDKTAHGIAKLMTIVPLTPLRESNRSNA